MTHTNPHSPVLMIAFDSAEPRLIERWTEDGTLPNLKRLREIGSYGRLASSAKWLDGSPWPTFYTGLTPSDHGVYSHTQWQAEQMKHAPVTPERYPIRPFWRCLGGTGRRVIAIDLPMTFPPEPFDGLEIYSLMNRDLLGPERVPTSYPKSLLEEMRQEFDFEDNLLGDEVWGMQHLEDLLLLRDQLIQGTRTMTKIAQTLMSREKWDLFIINFMATHRGGHKLWNLSNSWETIGAGKTYDALQDVYVACDAAVGQLVSAAGAGVTLLVFSLHGNRLNSSRSCLLPKMLHRVLVRETKYGKEIRQRAYLRPLQTLKECIPSDVRLARMRSRHLMPLVSLLFKMNSWLLAAKGARAIDWTATPAFTLESDLQGYVHVNLRGREALGIVEPGEEYDQLCSKIAEGLITFVDADSGEPVIEVVERTDQLFGRGRRLKDLPDLIIRWAPSPAANHRAVVSPRYGSILWGMPGHHPTGRSGNHGPEGFMLAVGTEVKQGSKIEGANILDLAPTVCALLKVPIPTEMCGKVIDLARS
jgi:predicted AlkP superfamily phosphohydrolase/phosphomutase